MSHPTPVVFVHGLFGPFDARAAFSQLAPADCSAPDLAGYGAWAATGPVSLVGQVDALRLHIQARSPLRPVHLVAHSIGAVYAFSLADAEPGLVASITTVEGNFSLADAFWSRSIAALGADDARTTIRQRLADPAAFLAADGIPPTAANLAAAEAALAFQPWRTVWESAIAIVDTTTPPVYEAMLRRVFARTAVHLVAGERSAAGWAVPGWARSAARSSTVIPGAGHMMMLEQPEAFGQGISRILGTAAPSRAAERP